LNTQLGPFAEYLCNLLGYDKFLPSSSGVEACESAIKLARRWGYTVKGVEHNKATVVLMKNNFWGRSITASGACTDPVRYTNFGPFTDGFPLVAYNNVQDIESYFSSDPNCVGIMIEPI
jgi:ornithine--oxo-acid transaminase